MYIAAISLYPNYTFSYALQVQTTGSTALSNLEIECEKVLANLVLFIARIFSHSISTSERAVELIRCSSNNKLFHDFYPLPQKSCIRVSKLVNSKDRGSSYPFTHIIIIALFPFSLTLNKGRARPFVNARKPQRVLWIPRLIL